LKRKLEVRADEEAQIAKQDREIKEKEKNGTRKIKKIRNKTGGEVYKKGRPGGKGC
jgi:hypothetical protein